MRLSRPNSLRAHIVMVAVLASGLAVALFTAAITYVNTRSAIAELDSRMATLADVIGQNSTAALDFNDKEAAGEVLSALRREVPVVSACLYDGRAALFSAYLRDARSPACAAHAWGELEPGSGHRRVVRPVARAGDVTGSIEVTADTADLQRRNRRMLSIALGLAALSLTLAGLCGTWLQRGISGPVVQLAAAMQRVTKHGSLDAQVNVEGAEEIAHLAAGFNRMILELERRNQVARLAESRLLEQARTDSLTGLPNRRHLAQILEEELERSRREKWMIGLLYIDLDGFKLVNDSLGHAAGDQLLCEVAKRLRSRVRTVDTLARVGGDEFTIILVGLENESDAMVAASGIIQSMSRPFLIEGKEITVGASIGISTRRPAGVGDLDLFKQADSAMYAAKRTGKNRAVHFSPEMGHMARERLTLEIDLRGAIGRGEIYVEYQPEWSAATGRLVRFEALARWRHPQLGNVSPENFIPVAEESGLIHALGRFVMEKACRECVEWQKVSPHPIEVAVNVSSLQFNAEGFLPEVEEILQSSGLRPELLQIELTESVMIGSLSQSTEKMKHLRSRGVSLAVDDFGTGYSCLGYLPALPFTALKIDRTFVRRLQLGPEVATMIRSLIELAKKMGLRVVVEGIEDAAQMKAVLEMGADELQGYLLGLPSSAPRADFAAGIAGRSRSMSEAARAPERAPILDAGANFLPIT
ncbi:EAL domain-containing protein [Acidobacteria bacterium AB60]|nr:EAL domain-containing protein [Acidobacteria bacterium AB60]